MLEIRLGFLEIGGTMSCALLHAFAFPGLSFEKGVSP